MAPRRGFLSPKRYFFQKGDVLSTEDIDWEVMRVHTWEDAATRTKIKYALLVGRHSELGDTPITTFDPMPNSNMDMGEFLTDYHTIKRAKTGCEDRTSYVKDEKGLFVEVD